ncbi:MAG: putative molibdopterin-dependent oxidoreductase YjgC [Candidatus Poriferisodalaceae bacterium]|jgi:predicted molibdopterin-dependent oxidoreductase YjgC|tara:strand:- start:1761 stop:2624 length:864 start_codon:yes stop_codon:yes gene_type:complete
MTDVHNEAAEILIILNGEEVNVQKDMTIREASSKMMVDIPTICWSENLEPANACRLCVVEVEGSKTLVPSCSRKVENGMNISTASSRVKASRRMILEFLATANDLSQAPEITNLFDDYGVDIDRYESPTRISAEVKIQDELYVRDYSKCILCYKCVDACGEQAQNTFAIAFSGRGYGTQVSTEFDVELPESDCVYCGNCVAVCPTNALQFKTEFDLRDASNWRPEDQTVTTTVCSYCGVGCNLELHTQDNQIVKVTSPTDHDVTNGNLCIKGRFGWEYVNWVEKKSH